MLSGTPILFIFGWNETCNASAFHVVSDGHTVFYSIHKPNLEVFDLFDDLIYCQVGSKCSLDLSLVPRK